MKPGVRELFGEGRNFPTLATAMEDGAPHAVSLWSGVEGEHIVFFTGRSTLKGRNIARDPRVALAVVDATNPYRTARVRGRVVDTIDGERAEAIIDRISERYTGGAYSQRGFTVYVVELTHETFEELDATPDA